MVCARVSAVRMQIVCTRSLEHMPVCTIALRSHISFFWIRDCGIGLRCLSWYPQHEACVCSERNYKMRRNVFICQPCEWTKSLRVIHDLGLLPPRSSCLLFSYTYLFKFLCSPEHRRDDGKHEQGGFSYRGKTLISCGARVY